MSPTKPTSQSPQSKGKTMQRAFLGLSAALTIAIVSTPSSQVQAQSENQTTVCMTNGNMWALLLPSRQAEMEAAGYSVAPCNGREAQAASYRTEICRYANTVPETVAALFEQDHGVSPRKLCDLAREVPQ